MLGAMGTLLVVGLAWINAPPGPDAAVPPSLVGVLERAREAARREAGFLGLAPARFAAARCSSDGATAVLTFESAIASARSFAIVEFPTAKEWDEPGAVIAIRGDAAEPSAGGSVASCRNVPSGPEAAP